jgi:hypothetical protein
MLISYSVDSLERKGNKNLERYQCNTCVLIGKHAFSLQHHLNNQRVGKKKGENLERISILLVRKLIETSGSNMLILSGPPIIIPCKKTQVIVISKFYLKNLKGSPKIPKNTRFC